MKRLILAMSAAALATAATAAPTRPAPPRRSEYAYFHRSGASMEAHDKDVAACVIESKRFRAGGAPTWEDGLWAGTEYGLSGVIGVAITPMLMSAMYSSPIRAGNFENCMVVRGWDLIAVSDEDGVRLSKLSQPELASQLAPLIGSAAPSGTVLRNFENDTPVYQYIRSAKRSLSLLAAKPQADATPPPKPKALPIRAGTTTAPSATKIAQLQLPKAGHALVIVRVIAKNSAAVPLTFKRVGADADTPAWVDGQPDSFIVAPDIDWLTGYSKEPDLILAFEVPVGRWAFSAYRAVVDNCLGAPAFDVQEGEVVFAGAFTVDHEPIGTAMDLEPARAFLATKPDIAARVKAARWVNGVLLPCGDIPFGYAFEVPGAPFVDGYRYGSKSHSSPGTSAPASQP